MKQQFVAGVIAAAMAGGVIAAIPAEAATDSPTPTTRASAKRLMSGWMPYWLNGDATTSFVNNADLFSDVSPFWHNAVASSSNASGISIQNNSLSSGTRASTLAKIKGKGAWVMPSITDGSGRLTMSGIMKNATKRKALVTQITNLVLNNGYDGIDLDFETFAFTDGYSTWASTRPAWVTFVHQLGSALHAKGKKLAVAVPPMYDSKRSGSSGYWVYDFAGIGSSVDRLRVMAYDYSWDSPGPIGGPISWARTVASYATSVVPADKVQLGTPTYGRDWVVSKTGSGCPSTSQKVYNTREIGSAISGISASEWNRDASSQERYVRYTKKYNDGKCKIVREAWLPDSTTVNARAQLVKTYRMAGIATWMVGSELSSQWSGLRNLARSLGGVAAKRSQIVTGGPSKKTVKRKKKIRINARLNPARKATVYYQKKVKGKWVTKRHIAVAANGVGSITFRPAAKKATWRLYVPATSTFNADASPSFVIRTK